MAIPTIFIFFAINIYTYIFTKTPIQIGRQTHLKSRGQLNDELIDEKLSILVLAKVLIRFMI